MVCVFFLFFVCLVDIVNPKTGKVAPMISKDTYEAVMENKEILDSAIIYDRDFQYNYVSQNLPP